MAVDDEVGAEDAAEAKEAEDTGGGEEIAEEGQPEGAVDSDRRPEDVGGTGEGEIVEEVPPEGTVEEASVGSLEAAEDAGGGMIGEELSTITGLLEPWRKRQRSRMQLPRLKSRQCS